MQPDDKIDVIIQSDDNIDELSNQIITSVI